MKTINKHSCQFTTFIILLFSLAYSAHAVVKEGQVITQIKGVPGKVTIKSASNPAVEQRLRKDGSYTINIKSATRDYLIIMPDDIDNNVYSPRIIPASQAGVDTLYIIPPTNKSITIIVDNKTNLDFSFIADKAIIFDRITTVEKDYQLTIIPQRPQATALVAAITPGYPAVVKSVKIIPGQGRGYLLLDPKDIGLIAPTYTAPAPLAATTAIPIPTENKTPAPSEPIIEEIAAPPVEREKTPDPVDPADYELSVFPMTAPKAKEEVKKDDSEYKVGLTKSSYYFSNRLILKDKRNASLALYGALQHFPKVDAAETMSAGLEFYNIKLFKNYFDIGLHGAQSKQFESEYYRASLTWHQSPYSSLDITYNSSQDETWYSHYNPAIVTTNVNGYYKSNGEKFQIGVGIRFRIDYGDFDTYFPDVVDSKFRYLPSFYIISFAQLGKITTSFMGGVIDEALYASVNMLFFRWVGLGYTFKGTSFDNSHFVPLESAMHHKLSLYLNIGLKNRTGQ